MDDRNFIYYSEKDHLVVKKLFDQIDFYLKREIGSSFDYDAYIEYFRGLLMANNILYRTVLVDGNDWTYWVPESHEQERELQLMTLTHEAHLKSGSLPLQ
ncbi:MAG: hypothetical protein COC09_01410 [Gammaproteobacteria bacterium]|nr:hypothetical protein [Gammaproteobacteria bacterium]PCH64626.1 MAG: hypothetical protein COC09_01410 [Gammaproteobacteria bacterium]